MAQYFVEYWTLVSNLKIVSNITLNNFCSGQFDHTIGSNIACNVALCVQALGNHSNILFDCHSVLLRSETGWAEFGYFLCYSKWLLPELSFSDRWSRRTKTLGMRLRDLRLEKE